MFPYRKQPEEKKLNPSALGRIIQAPIFQKVLSRYLRVQDHNAQNSPYPMRVKATAYLQLMKLQEQTVKALTELRAALIDGRVDEYFKDIEVKVILTETEFPNEHDDSTHIVKNIAVSTFESGDMAKANTQLNKRNKDIFNKQGVTPIKA